MNHDYLKYFKKILGVTKNCGEKLKSELNLV